MKTKMDGLLARFRSLQSNNPQETKRNFNEFIDAIRRDAPREEDLDAFIASIEPKTKLENVLKVEILIRFKRYDGILDVLKSGSPMLIGKVLKCWKLFEVLFATIDARTLVDKIFPQTSFSTRMKIITRLSTNLKNEELADEYFRAIEDKYGLSVARGLLPACTLNLIKSTVANYKLNLTSRQLLSIFKRDREFLVYYFGVLRQTHGEHFYFSGKYPEVLRYVAKVDGKLFWELFKTYKLMSKFGRHMTPRLYESGKEVVTASAYDQNLFNLRKLYKVIGENPDDLHRFISKLLPAKADAFAAECSSPCLKTLIGCISRKKRYEVLNACFEKAYGKSIHELLSVDTPVAILELMPVKEREVIVDKKVQSDEDLIYLYPPKRAIPLLQERIKLTSHIHKRTALVEKLVKTCSINQDSESLLEVLKYLRSRHRNDNNALSALFPCLDDWPHIERLTGEHWTYISEIVNICNRISNYGLYYFDISFMLKYSLYLLRNKMPCEEFMETSLLSIKDQYGHFDIFNGHKFPECQKMCLEHFARLLPKLYTGDQFQSSSSSLLSAMIDYNNKYSKNKITISQYPLLMEAVDKYKAADILRYFLKFEDDGTGDRIFWDHHEKMCNADMILWYLRKRPNIIEEHVDKILTPAIIKELGIRLPKILNLASMHASVSEKIVGFSLNALHDNDAAVSKFAAMSLSYLTTKEKYFETVRPFVPHSDGKIDFKIGKESFVYTLQALVNGLPNLDDPVSCLPILKEFCVGDYMKYASKSLYQLVNHVPESKLESFLDSLYNSAVSVRKHAVYATTGVSPKTTVYKFLKTCGQNDKHPSLRKAIFKSTLRYFTANPSEEFWDLLKDNVKIIDENDRETLGCLVDLRKIPDGYLPEYISMAYTILSSNKDKATQVKKYSLLKSVQNESLDKLNATFLVTVIKDIFPGAIQNTDFYLKCLFYTTGPNNTLVLDLVFNILKDYIEKNCAVSESRADLYRIIHTISVRAVPIKSGKDLIEKFMKFWSSTIKQGELLEEYLLLQLADARISSESNPRGFGVKVSEILSEWVGSHGSSIVTIFAALLNYFLFDFSNVSDELKQFEFIDGLFRANDADFNCILTLNLLFDRVRWADMKDLYGSVLAKIKEHQSSAVQFFLQRRLRRLEIYWTI